MKRINTILTLSVCVLVLSGCGVAENISEGCSGDLDPVCDMLFGQDSERQQELDAEQERAIARLQQQVLDFNDYLQDLEAATENNSQLIDVIEVQMAQAQADIAELQTRSTVEEFIDPCGDSAGFDEVLLWMSSGELVAYFESGSRRFLTILKDGNYRTTDKQRCRFSVVNGEYVE